MNTSKTKKVDTQEVGLLIAMIFGRFFLKTRDLHYGYWPEGLLVSAENLPEAQKHHSRFLISHIPEGVKTILDVGGGTGKLASQLAALGHKVDSVCPSQMMIEFCRAEHENGFNAIHSTYEDFKTDKRYDLILFSESFQYVDLIKSFAKSLELLNEGGHLLICDFFKTEAPGKGPLSGGHRLSRFYRLIEQHSFQKVIDLDITRFAAPTMTLMHELLQNVGVPIRDVMTYTMRTNHPRITRIISRLYKKRLARLQHKYFSGERNAKNFELYKSYRLLLYRKAPLNQAESVSAPS